MTPKAGNSSKFLLWILGGALGLCLCSCGGSFTDGRTVEPGQAIDATITARDSSIADQAAEFIPVQAIAAQAIALATEIARSGNTSPIDQSAIEPPANEYSRCDFFDMFDMDSMVDQTSPKLEIYITKTGGIPGPPSWELGNYPGFDQMPLQFSATFDDIAATDVGVRDTHPGRLYSVFEVPASYLHTAREYRLFVNQCETPIYSEWLLVYPPTATPDICRPPPGGCPSGSDWWQDLCICGAN